MGPLAPCIAARSAQTPPGHEADDDDAAQHQRIGFWLGNRRYRGDAEIRLIGEEAVQPEFQKRLDLSGQVTERRPGRSRDRTRPEETCSRRGTSSRGPETAPCASATNVVGVPSRPPTSVIIRFVFAPMPSA